MARRSYSNTAVATTLSADINATANSFTVTGTVTGYPSSNSVLTLDRGEPSEERVLYTTRSGSSFTGVTRGYDGTAAASHSSGSAVEHTLTAADLDEPNALVNLPEAKGDLPVASGADTWARLPVGANGLFLVTDAAQALGVKWASQEVAIPNSPLGTLGYSKGTDQSIPNDANIQLVAITFTAGTSRRIRASASAEVNLTGGAGFEGQFHLDGINQTEKWSRFDNSLQVSSGFTVSTPSAGTHTYRMMGNHFSGGGCSVTRIQLLVEDIGSS